MLHAWAKHAGWSLRIRCKGDLISMLDGFLDYVDELFPSNVKSLKRILVISVY